MDAQAVDHAEPDVERTAELVHDTARGLELTAAGFRPLRVGNHVVLGSLDGKVVARVAYTSRRPLEYHAAHLRLVEQLAAAGAPFVAPLCAPCRLRDGRVVTFWPMHSPAGQVPLEALVELVSRCHRTEATGDLTVWDPSVSYLTRWADRLPMMTARGVPADVRAFLEEVFLRRVEALAECWGSLSGEAHPQVLIHGDPHPPNVVRLGDRTLALIDLDFIEVGPPEVDLCCLWLLFERHDREPRVADRILAAYDGAANNLLMAQIYAADEINELVWLACLWGVVPGADAELMRRVDNWGDPTVKWQEF
ncbi:MAG: aminoglycoside phosphotransferase family protein [Acidimicrobiaceae bacterium]|nr:aminoglycoside phosphotransferase family protein [Acidimicrobiaceae bacterium]